MFTSIHVNPSDCPPFFACYPDERGIGDGLGASFNIALKKGSAEDMILVEINKVIAMTKTFGAEAIVVSLGFDMVSNDPFPN